MPECSPNRVRELREMRALSQSALAAAARLSRQSINAIEAGRSLPAVDVALRLARALDCPVETLFAVPAAEPAFAAFASYRLHLVAELSWGLSRFGIVQHFA